MVKDYQINFNVTAKNTSAGRNWRASLSEPEEAEVKGFKIYLIFQLEPNNLVERVPQETQICSKSFKN